MAVMQEIICGRVASPQGKSGSKFRERQNWGIIIVGGLTSSGAASRSEECDECPPTADSSVGGHVPSDLPSLDFGMAGELGNHGAVVP